jgi:hypothetical protein
MSNEITSITGEKLTPESVVGQIVELENEAATHSAKAREVQAKADELRKKLVDTLMLLGIESVRHASGYTATVAHKTAYKLPTADVLIEKLKANKLNNFISKVPAHEEPNTTLLTTWLKEKAPNDIAQMFGDAVQIKQTEFLQLRKAK